MGKEARLLVLLACLSYEPIVEMVVVGKGQWPLGRVRQHQITCNKSHPTSHARQHLATSAALSHMLSVNNLSYGQKQLNQQLIALLGHISARQNVTHVTSTSLIKVQAPGLRHIHLIHIRCRRLEYPFSMLTPTQYRAFITLYLMKSLHGADG